MSTVKLEKKVLYTGTITLKTGLHIGGTNAALNIGGPDKFVVRNPINHSLHSRKFSKGENACVGGDCQWRNQQWQTNK